ncbi:hypothetical protein [uncultured Tenacibaculum sp.]|uniref:hypothetical protein n=1 Tax=uncultured Tenacibaculum sp. TaxID=174713 RepID=UPI00262113AE|nr:hypothetical protein [uncultured Tenacibaculum sp.]
MKKILCIIAFVAFAFNGLAQDGKLRLGANIGFTTGGNNSDLVIGADLDYLFNAENKRFQIGAASGLFVVTDFNGIVLPLAFAGRFDATDKINLGVDAGYGIGINNANNGFYFRPIFEYKLSSNIALRASYTGIGGGGYLNAGIMFNL